MKFTWLAMLCGALLVLCASIPAFAAGNEKELPPAEEAAPPEPPPSIPETPAELTYADERGNEKGLRVLSESWRERRLYEDILTQKEAEARAAEAAAEASEGRPRREIRYYRRHYYWDPWWPYWGPSWGPWYSWHRPYGLHFGVGVYHRFGRP